MKQFTFVLLIHLLIVGTTLAQDTVLLSKSDLIAKLTDKNLQVHIAEKTYHSARADYRQSNALFLPHISASHAAIYTTNPLMAFGSKLNQEVLTAADFNPDLLNDPDGTENYATTIDVLQPLINLDGLYERQAARSKMEAYELQAERSQEYIVLEVNKAYMQLQLAYKAVATLKKAVVTAEENLSMFENYFEQGLIQKPDLLAVEVRVNEVRNQLQYAESNIRNASDYLRLLFNEEQTERIYRPAEDINGEIETTAFQAVLPENRKDIVAMERSTEAYHKMARSSKLNLLPRLNAFGSYQLYDDRLFRMDASGYTIGAQLSWDLFDGYTSIGKMEKAKLDFQKAQAERDLYRAQSQLELNKTLRQLNDAENNVRLSEMAYEQSSEAYRIRKDRFSGGLEKTTDVLMAETQMVRKELEYQQALFEYNFTKQYLEFLTR